MLGNDGTGAQMEQVRFTFTVPTGQNEYAVIYRYAIVLENPNHTAIQQPFFKVKAYDSATNNTVNCGNFSYVSSSSLPGFVSVGGSLYYKDWSTASLNLSGQGGNTIVVEFTTSDCSQTGHFGYAYVDMNCGLFAIRNSACVGSVTAPLSAPPGFQSYTWYDSSYNVVGTGQNVNVPSPGQRTVYRVRLVPYPGYGCTDTLSTAIIPAVLNVDAGKDTTLCNIPFLQLPTIISGSAPPLTYSWTASTGTSSLSCTSCSAPTVTPTSLTSYYLTVTDNNGCVTKDTVSVLPTAGFQATNITPVSCFGNSDGSISLTPQNGTAPLTFRWNTPPVTGQTSTSISGLAAGSYSITITDGKGCVTQPPAFVVPQPSVLGATISASQNILCNGANTGSATVTATGGTAPYSYSWNNTTPAQTTATANNLPAGPYTVTVTDANGCVKTASVTVTQPPMALSVTATKKSSLCSGINDGTAKVTASGGTPPYTYSWNTSPVQTTDSISNLAGGVYTATVTDANGCTSAVSVTILQVISLNLTATQTNISCQGGSNGTATATTSGGTLPYTYSWNTTPAQTTPAISGLTAGSYMVTVTDSNGCMASQPVSITEPAALQLSSVQTNVLCNGDTNGTATVTANGGTAPYAYSWITAPPTTSNSLNGLPAGSYVATVVDAKNCIDTLSVTITQPAVLGLSMSQTDVLCNGGSSGTATVAVTGGTTPYSYSWNTTPAQTTATATNLPIGTYTVVVTDANGCGQTDSTSIAQPTALTATATHTDVFCNGGNNGTATVTATGGTTPYSYSWNSTPAQTTATASNLPAGTYTATVTDANGCIKRDTVTLVAPAALSVSPTQTNVSCNGGSNGSAAITVSGGTAPYSYSWNTTPAQTTTSISNLAAGSYQATVTDSNGCVQTVLVTITQPAVLLPSTAQTNISCNGSSDGTATITASGGTAPYSHSWNTTPVQTTASISSLIAGTYTDTVTDANGCTQTAQVTITQPAALTATATHTDVQCNGGNNGSATVVASGGTAPYSYSWNSTPAQTTATASNLPAGTYTVIVTDANGCTKGDTVKLTQPTLLGLSTTQTDVLCNGANTGSATVTATGGTASYSYSWNTTPAQTTTSISTLTAGTYTATVTDASGCVQTTQVTIAQPALFSLSITQTNVSCNGSSDGTAAITASGGTAPYSYSWNTTPAQTTTSISTLTAGTYTATVTDANGCVQTTQVTITQPAVLTATASKTDVSCNGGSNGSATVAASGGTAPYSYSWNTTPVQTTASISGLPAGSYTVTVTDAKGCTQSDTTAVVAPGALTLSTTHTDVICAGGNTGTATVTAGGGTTPYTYSWNTTPVKTTTTISGLPAGSYIATVTDAKGCTQTATAIVAQPAVLTAATTKTDVSCNGSSNGSATVTANGGTAPYTYNWNTTPAQTTATISGVPAGSYTATVTDANGCTQTPTAIIAQPAPLVLVAVGNNPLCYGNVNGTAVVAVNGGTLPYSYSWNTTPVQTNASASGLAPGTYTVTVTDARNCTGTTTVTLLQPDSLSLSLTSSNVTCAGGNDGSVFANVTGGTLPYAYTWNSNASLNNAGYSNFTAGTQTVRVTDGNGCTKTATVTLTSPTPVTATLVVDSVPCFGAATGVVRVASTRGGTAPYEYYWQGSSSPQTATLQNLSAGNYTVRILDFSGCASNFTINLPQHPSQNLFAGVDAAVCAGSSIDLQATGASVQWQWTPATDLSCSTCAHPTATPGQNTTYFVTGTDTFGCTATDSLTITVQQRNAVSVGSPVQLCVGATATLSASGGDRYQWTPITGLSCSDCPNPTITDTVDNNYQVIISQGDCFVDTLYQNVIIASPPTVQTSPDVLLASGGQITLQTTASASAKTFSWSPKVGLNCYNCRTPTVVDARSITYIVTATTAYGCTASDSVRVTVACDGSPFFVANTFTPNSDGRDDWFYPQGTGIVRINRMLVQNRWGETVFERNGFSSNNPESGWDGSYKGQPMASGTFMYLIEAICDSGEQLILKGDINLIR